MAAGEAGQKKLTENPVRDFLTSQHASLRWRPESCIDARAGNGNPSF